MKIVFMYGTNTTKKKSEATRGKSQDGVGEFNRPADVEQGAKVNKRQIKEAAILTASAPRRLCFVIEGRIGLSIRPKALSCLRTF
jgi:hypothetical protein